MSHAYWSIFIQITGLATMHGPKKIQATRGNMNTIAQYPIKFFEWTLS